MFCSKEGQQAQHQGAPGDAATTTVPHDHPPVSLSAEISSLKEMVTQALLKYTYNFES